MFDKRLLILIIIILISIILLLARNEIQKIVIKIRQVFNRKLITKERSIEYWLNEDLNKYFTKYEIPDTEDYIVLVEKEYHKLKLVKELKVIKEYKVNIRNELPDRLLENDGQTPEGIFEIYQLAVVTDPAWSRWIAFDTTEKAKNIFVKEYSNGYSILNKYETLHGIIKNDTDIKKFNLNNPKTPMLRGFGIHGGGYHPGNDWTWGCPAMNDNDVMELYDILINSRNKGIGVLVIIQD